MFLFLYLLVINRILYRNMEEFNKLKKKNEIEFRINWFENLEVLNPMCIYPGALPTGSSITRLVY